jgi:hypothetical protein
VKTGSVYIVTVLRRQRGSENGQEKNRAKGGEVDHSIHAEDQQPEAPRAIVGFFRPDPIGPSQ